MFIQSIGIEIYGVLSMLLSALGIFAIGFAEGDNEDEIVFKNQEALNDMVEKRLAKQKKTLLDEQESKFEKMKDDLDEVVSELKDDLKEAKQAKSTGASDDPKMKDLEGQLKNLDKEMKKLTKEKEEAVQEALDIKTSNREGRIESKIVSLLADRKVVAPKDIYLILKESKNIAINEDGEIIPVYAGTENQVVGTKGGQMDLEEFIDGWLKERPHFVSASGRIGSETTPVNTSRVKKPNDGENTNEDKPQTMTEILASKEHQEIESDLIGSGKLQHGGEDLE